VTTDEVVAAADPENIASRDINLRLFLKNNALPAYLHDLGYPFFSRDQQTAQVAADATFVDLNGVTNIRSIKHVSIQVGSEWPALDNIGEDSARKLTALRDIASGTSAKPTGWWLSWSGTGWNRINFDKKTDSSYWVGIEWYRSIPYDGVSNLQLDPFIPPDMQFPLVLLCRAEKERNRIGQGENRYPITMQEYQMWLERVITNLQKTANNKRRHIR